VLGNHDHFGAFFAYFGRKAGPKGRGYYAFDLGAWRVYALDSNCELRKGCAKRSAQYRWLKRDLEEHRPTCSIAVLHNPTFSSGSHGNTFKTVNLIALLYSAGNDIVVNSHDHIYERFQRARPWGRVDRDHGMRQFIVGTGGAPLYGFRKGRPPHSQVRQNSTHGVLRLRLSEDRYDWAFLAAGRSRFTDSGETACHEPPPAQ
jgi:alkaline phosphatase